MKAIFIIKIERKKGAHGIGFFINYWDTLKYHMTNYHVINPSLENENIY